MEARLKQAQVAVKECYNSWYVSFSPSLLPSLPRAETDVHTIVPPSLPPSLPLFSPDIPRIVKALVEGGVDAMQKACEVAVGTPVKPMLAKICR